MTDTVDGVSEVSAGPALAGSLAAVVRRMWRASRRTCDLYERLARRTSIPVLGRHYRWCGEEEHTRGDELVALLAELGVSVDDDGVTGRCSPCTRRHGGLAEVTGAVADERWRTRHPHDVLSHELALLDELALVEARSDWPGLAASAGEPLGPGSATDVATRGRRLARAAVADGAARRAWAAEARRRLALIRANGVCDADELADHVRNTFG